MFPLPEATQPLSDGHKPQLPSVLISAFLLLRNSCDLTGKGLPIESPIIAGRTIPRPSQDFRQIVVVNSAESSRTTPSTEPRSFYWATTNSCSEAQRLPMRATKPGLSTNETSYRNTPPPFTRHHTSAQDGDQFTPDDGGYRHRANFLGREVHRIMK